jgi:glutathionylspermidine synthase
VCILEEFVNLDDTLTKFQIRPLTRVQIRASFDGELISLNTR